MDCPSLKCKIYTMCSSRFLFFLIACLLFFRPTIQSAPLADRPPLERMISVDIRNERLENALKLVSDAGQFSFAYNSTLFSAGTLVSVSRGNYSVREVLNALFRGTIAYKERGNHVILQRAEMPDETSKNFILDGYIIDNETGRKITQASIYEKTTLASTVSNPYGYYRIKLPTELTAVQLEVRRKYYIGQTVRIAARQSHTVNILLTPSPVQTSLQPLPVRMYVDTTRPAFTTPQPVVTAIPLDSATLSKESVWDRSKSVLDQTKTDFAEWFRTTRQAIHDANLAGDTLHRYTQLSLLPFVGTNHTLSGRVINHYSFNLIGGYSLGVHNLEVGGVANLVRGDVNGLQISGFANAVGEHVAGVQLAGFTNAVRRNFDGIQLAGFSNNLGGDFRGIQAAGFANVTLGRMSRSIQGAGFGNVVLRDFGGLQAAGFANAVTQDMQGFQLAGFGNLVVRNTRGWQLSGFMNLTAGRLDGWQLSGFLNYADEVVRGHQFALINIAQSSETTPYGFLSYVQQNGYRRLEVSTDEMNSANLTFKTGIRRFYNIFTAGIGLPLDNRPAWSFGYGFGTAFDLRRGWGLNVDLTSNWALPQGWQRVDDGATLLRLQPSIEKKLSRHLALAVGPSLNAALSTSGRFRPDTRVDVPLFSRQPVFVNSWLTGWVGFQAALRLCN